MPQQADLYAQMGIAAILPGLTRAVEILQSEIDGLREMLTKAASGEPIVRRRGRPPGSPNETRRKTKAYTNGSGSVPAARVNTKSRSIRAASYWATMTPEERSAEMKRRQKVSATRKAAPARNAQIGKASRSRWQQLSKKERAARIAAMNQARQAKKQTAEARVQ